MGGGRGVVGAAEQEGAERFAQQVSAEGEPGLFRRGMLRIARATGTAEKAWPAEVLEELARRAGQPS
ncbi:hypothetical protein [Streptomyces sp. S1]|uniref:hypothetical protein n=1 Tax=Streptomyces sp. S1 TaxID=718288 RepID=UPI003D750C91